MSALATRPDATRGLSGTSRVLGLLLAVATVGAAVPTLAGDVLRGPAVMNGSARGTALVVLVVALPLLLVALASAGRGSARGHAVLLGALAYLTYNAALFLYATPFNELFLVYVAMLSLGFWSLVSVLVGRLPVLLPGRGFPARSIAAFILAVVGLNAAAWLARIVPELGSDRPQFLAGTGLPTNPIFVQDLAIWLPALGVVAVLLLRRHRLGVLLAGAGLVFWQVEAVGVAVDQWFGHHAAPGSDVATLGGAILFVVVAALTAVPLTLWWRTVDGLRDWPA